MLGLKGRSHAKSKYEKYNNFYNAIAIEHKKEPYDLLIAQIDPLILMMLDA